MPYLTPSEAAFKYSVSTKTIYRIVKRLRSEYSPKHPPMIQGEGKLYKVDSKYLSGYFTRKRMRTMSPFSSASNVSTFSAPKEAEQTEQQHTVSKEIFERVVGSLEGQVEALGGQMQQQGRLIEKLTDQLRDKDDMIDQLVALNTRIALRMGSEPTHAQVEISEAQEVTQEDSATEFTYTDWLRKSRSQGEA